MTAAMMVMIMTRAAIITPMTAGPVSLRVSSGRGGRMAEVVMIEEVTFDVVDVVVDVVADDDGHCGDVSEGVPTVAMTMMRTRR